MLEYLLLTPGQLIANSYVMMAFAFAVSIIALSFMAGEFMSMPSLKGFAKAELYELGVSAVILVILLVFIIPGGPFDMIGRGFMAPVQPVDPNAPPPPYVGPALCKEWRMLHGDPVIDASGTWSVPNGNIVFGQANYFLGCAPDFANMDWNPFGGIPPQSFSGVMTSRLAKGYVSLMLTQMFTGLLAGFYTSISLSMFKVLSVDVGFVPWVALGPLNQAHTTIVDLIGTTFAAFTAQNMLLKFIEKSAIAFFLPFGLMLRAFPFTRKTGSTIIAVMVAAYFIYPVSILINEQIWIMIADPPCQGGAVVGGTCQEDADCCSFNCRAGVCSVKVTDFKEYASIYEICEDPEEIDATLAQIAKEQDDRMLEIYFSGNPSTTEPTQAEARLNDGLGTLAKQNAQATWTFTKSLLNPLPGHTAQTVFSQIEVMVVDAGQFALLGMIFTVITIVMSLTMLKDFAILIGGEPRIFGLSKLV
ncbi:MAG: hypothetical protein WC717_02525 [Candidatus Micrarchaeia archaeon]|jgi:hypothetical protein